MTEPRDLLAKAYVPSEFEAGIYERWLAADVFAPDGRGSTADETLPPFTVIQPPPNVTGSLHLGHAQRTAVEDLMIRHARMVGHPTLYLPGLDHASIAAQFVLDGILAKEGQSRQSLGRERYLERMHTFVEDTRVVMLEQQRRVGGSFDWSRLRFTMDEVSAKAVRVAFERLYRDGLAYRTEGLINWCPGCRTSVSDLEVVATPETGKLWTVRYHLLDESTGQPSADDTISVATTRPETILGDTAVAVHPADARYAALVGRRLRIPFVERDVPIIADEAVDREFGTGAVKVTPAHDHDDHEMALRHELPMITVLDDEARITGTGTAYDGLDRFEARARIVEDLARRGDLVDERAHEMVIGRCQRSDDIIEPRLKTQWFVRTRPLADAALAATRDGRTTIFPAHFEKTWEHWLTNIRDWNVSRQLWWGHRIPAWYCPDGHVTVSADPNGPAACEVCGRGPGDLTQDPDIFDTWFSSGLWPFSTLGWPDDTPDYQRFYPTSVMETGYDILFFWVARMMMLGIHLTGVEPFSSVYLSGLIRDPYGQKMSKTRGNTVDPLDMIDELGADAMRFALIHGTTPGNDVRFGRAKVENARNFANKLWNATRFVLGEWPSTIPRDAERQAPDPGALGAADRWLLSRVAATTASVDEALRRFEFGEVTRLLYDGIWSELCDWAVELAKVRFADPDLSSEQKEATWWALVQAVDTYLRLLHPVMPFVTERLWSALPHRAADPSLLIVARWPIPGVRDEAVEDQVAAVIDLIRAIRNARAEAPDQPAAPRGWRTRRGAHRHRRRLGGHRPAGGGRCPDGGTGTGPVGEGARRHRAPARRRERSACRGFVRVEGAQPRGGGRPTARGAARGARRAPARVAGASDRHARRVTAPGRPALRSRTMPRLERLAGPVLAVDIGGTHVRAAMVDAAGHVHHPKRIRTPVDDGGPAIVRAAIDLLGTVRVKVKDQLVGVGISSAGPVDPHRGWILDPPNLGATFRDLAIADEVSTALSLPAFLDRDTQVAALGEGTFGAARGVRDFLYLTVSTGIGGAVMSDGRLLRGPDGTAGELGHVLIDRLTGPPCGCGVRGHLEGIASGSGIARTARTAAAAGESELLAELVASHGMGFGAVHVAAAEDAGDPAASLIMADARDAFAQACVTFADLFDPDLIVVGGGLAAGQGDRLLQPARDAVASLAFRAPARRARIVPAALGDDVSLVGAAVLVAERLAR
jgi:valyl-tRNA synthetase